jgi:hypothetical protein
MVTNIRDREQEGWGEEEEVLQQCLARVSVDGSSARDRRGVDRSVKGKMATTESTKTFFCQTTGMERKDAS